MGSKATVGLFGNSLESTGDFSMRCQCLVSNLLRWCVGKCGEYIAVKVRRSSALCGLFDSNFACLGFNPTNALVYDLMSVSPFLHIFDHVSLCTSET